MVWYRRMVDSRGLARGEKLSPLSEHGGDFRLFRFE